MNIAKEGSIAPELVQVTIFQAPYITLMDHGLYEKIHSVEEPFSGPVPAEYYLPVYSGEITSPEELPDSSEGRVHALLEHIYYIFNMDRPKWYCARSLSVGDVVLLEGKYYLCSVFGFREVMFTTSGDNGQPKDGGEANG